MKVFLTRKNNLRLHQRSIDQENMWSRWGRKVSLLQRTCFCMSRHKSLCGLIHMDAPHIALSALLEFLIGRGLSRPSLNLQYKHERQKCTPGGGLGYDLLTKSTTRSRRKTEAPKTESCLVFFFLQLE